MTDERLKALEFYARERRSMLGGHEALTNVLAYCILIQEVKGR